jgi:hypothetical protein
LRQHAADNAAQRIVDESVVLKSIVHGLSEILGKHRPASRESQRCQ